MLSFKVLCEDNREETVNGLLSFFDGEVRDEVSEIVDGMLSFSDEDTELAVTAFSGCILFRIFDMGRYIFPLPYEISKEADIRAAIYEIAEYAMRQEIGLVYTDVAPDMLPLFSHFRHITLDKEGVDEDSSYRISVSTECELLSEFPGISDGEISLSALSEEDTEVYARLCRDEEIIKVWGYDYREDVKEASDAYFIENAFREFNLGISITLAVRRGEDFVGEATIYGFDGMGNAEIAIRILPEYRKEGVGSKALSLLIELARKIGLVRLVAYVFSDNIPSVRMTEKYMVRLSEDGGRVKFSLDIYK